MTRQAQVRSRDEVARKPSTARSRLVDAAQACFERFGVSKTTLDDIAAEAGVSRATVYRYFEGGREEVILSVVLRETRAFLQTLVRRISNEASPGDAIVEAVVQTVANVDHNPQMALLFSADSAGQTTALAGRSTVLFDVSRDFLGPLFESAAEAGQLREGVTVEDATEFVLRMVLSLLSVPGPRRRTANQQRAFVRTYCAGALVSEEGEPPAASSSSPDQAPT